jgi:lysophospholipase L1-like esterase
MARTRRLFTLLVIAGSIAATVTAIEISYRIYLNVSGAWVTFTPDGLKVLPNGHGKLRQGKVTTDKHGARNALGLDVIKREKRILVIGDSVAFGFGVDDERVFTHLLNHRFAESEIGFINLSRPSWDTPGFRDLLFIEGIDFNPQALLWVYYINDAKTSLGYRPTPTKKRYPRLAGDIQWGIYRFLRWPFLLKPVLQHLLAWAHLRKDGPKGTGWPAYYRWFLDAYRPGTKTRENEKRYMKDIIRWSKDNHCLLLLILTPAYDQLKDGQTAPQDFVRQVAERAGVPVLDLLPVFKQTIALKHPYLPDDPAHWNREGHRIVAEAISKWIACSTTLGKASATH